MTRVPLLPPRVGGGDAASCLTWYRGVAGGGADPPDLDVDLDPDEEEDDVILLGVQELHCRRDTVAASGGGIPRGG